MWQNLDRQQEFEEDGGNNLLPVKPRGVKGAALAA
jgi:hypothetical protein